MTNPVVINEEPIMMAHLKDTLKAIKKRDEELNFRAGKTEEYLNNFVTLKSKEAEELANKIRELNIPRLKEEHITKIVDVLPDHQEEVKITLQGYTVTVTKENLKKIADVVSEYTKK
jgi:DNA-directed RNA polymerase subunit F